MNNGRSTGRPTATNQPAETGRIQTGGHSTPSIAAQLEGSGTDPANLAAHVRLARLLIEEEAWEKALTVCRQGLQLTDDAAELHDLLGRCLIKTGDAVGAIDSFRKALALDPKLPRVHERLGEALLQDERPGEALSAYRKSLKRRPKAHGLHAMIGLCHSRKGNHRNAAASYRKAIALAPGKAWLHEQLGAALRAHERWQEAADAYQEAIRLNPNAPELHNWLGLCLAKSGDMHSAAANYWKEFELHPLQQAERHITVAAEMVRRGQLHEAVTLYQTMIETQPALPLRFYHAFLDAAQRLGTVEQVISAYRTAAESKSSDDQSQVRIGALCAAAGEPGQALIAYQRAFAINPEQPWAVRQTYAELLAEFGYRKEAEHCRQSATAVPADLASRCTTMWQALFRNDWQAIDADAATYRTEFQVDAVEHHFYQSPQCRVIDADATSDISDHGIDPLVIARYRADAVCQQPELHHRFTALAHANDTESEPPTLARCLIDFGFLYAWCPIGGNIVRSDHCLGADTSIIHGVFRFEGAEPFYLITNQAWTGIAALYLPERETAIGLEERLDAAQISDLVRRFKTLSVIRWQSVRRYLASERPKQRLCPLNQPPQSGPAMWSTLEALQQHSNDGRLERIDCFLAAPDSIHEHLTTLFPEIRPDRLTRCRDDDRPTVLDCVLEQSLLAVRCSKPVIGQTTAERVAALADELCPQTIKSRIGAARRHSVLLWVVLDAGRHRWGGQEAGIETVINLLCDRFPNVGVIFSATSTHRETEPAGTDSIRRQRERAMAQEIGHFLDPSVTTYQLFDAPAAEQIVWAAAADLYVAPRTVGSNWFPWIVDKPGVLYGPDHPTGPDAAVPDQVREGATVPVIVGTRSEPDHEESNETIEEDPPTGLSIDDRYDCDPGQIHAAAVAIIGTLDRKDPSSRGTKNWLQSLIGAMTRRAPSSS